ncbi:uncharacterized protein LOC115444529 isoform X2 [Manduca sexta]|uniref:uncharacterized protein LOC115444529 isoform X2 n=1 Tax=Manduca sexta TaxID=7130 RepID=UPI00188E700B|nr:uncharacterized protein LOC115444529 isoform X2 [Manduca sexta]
MKRILSNKSNVISNKKSRLPSQSATSTGNFCVDEVQSHCNEKDSEEDNVHPNVLIERVLTTKLEQIVEKFCAQTKPIRNVSGEKIVCTFDPDNHEMNIINWLAKIDQLGLVHKWDEYSKIVIMQTRLVGQAQLWFSRLDEYNYTWEQWKSLLINAFPRKFEYADILEELVARKKVNTETITHYYHDKLAMCRRCRLDDAASLSCLIRGLPLDLQNNAKAFKCDTPEEFYSGYLSTFESYRNKTEIKNYNNNYSRISRVEPGTKRTTDVIPSTSRTLVNITPRRMNCFRCNSTEHLVKDCPIPDKRICKFCSEVGHNIYRCPKMEKLIKKSNDDTVPINIVQNLNDIYRKEVCVGENIFSGYLDTGAQLNVVTLKMVNKLKYNVRETDALLKGFTGYAVPAMGQVNLIITVDGLTFDTTAIVTHLKLPADVDILIGQPIINAKGVSLVTTQNAAMLKDEIEVNNELLNAKFKVTAFSDVELPPKASAFVEVNILGNATEVDVYTLPRFYDLNNKNFAVPAALLTGLKGYIRIYNLGQEKIFWKKDDLISRAVPCDLIEARSLETNCEGKIDGTKLQADKVEVRNC